MGQRKSYKRKNSLSKIKVTPRVSENEGSSLTNANVLDCFQFLLEEPTSLILKASIGESVFGDFSDKRILIMNRSGALGYVPDDLSKRLISVANNKQVSILGTIIEKTGTEIVMVEICL